MAKRTLYRFLFVLTKLGAKWLQIKLRREDPSAMEGGQGSSGAESTVDPPCKVCNSPFTDQFLQEFGLLFNIMGFLLLHYPGGQLVVVVQRCSVYREVVAEAGEAHLVTQQAG